MTTPHTDTDAADAIRAWAKGIYSMEAAAELLIRAGLASRGPWLTEFGGPGPRMIAINVDKLAAEAEAGWMSGSEAHVASIAASLLGGPAVDLSEALSGLDRPTAALVLAAMSHATGSHEHGGVTIINGHLHRGTPPGPLYPWPESQVQP